MLMVSMLRDRCKAVAVELTGFIAGFYIVQSRDTLVATYLQGLRTTPPDLAASGC